MQRVLPHPNPELPLQSMTGVGFITINLTNGDVSFPPELALRLAGASPEELALIEITPLARGCIGKLWMQTLVFLHF